MIGFPQMNALRVSRDHPKLLLIFIRFENCLKFLGRKGDTGFAGGRLELLGK
jgi:hypothetical protein